MVCPFRRNVEKDFRTVLSSKGLSRDGNWSWGCLVVPRIFGNGDVWDWTDKS